MKPTPAEITAEITALEDCKTEIDLFIAQLKSDEPPLSAEGAYTSAQNWKRGYRDKIPSQDWASHKPA